MNMKIKISSLIVSAAILSAASAGAQEAILDKARPDYDAKGINLGGFNLKPKLDLEETYDDNIYSSDNSEVEDFITTISPSVALQSDWSRHSVGLEAGADFIRYQDESSEDVENYNIGANARFDIVRDTYLFTGLSYQELTEQRGSPDTAANAAEPTNYSDLTGNIGFYRGLRKVSLRVDSEAKKLNYDDGSTIAGAKIENDDRDRDQYNTTVNLGYEFIPDYQAFLRGTYDARRYDDTSALDRDSDGYEIVAGTSVNISGKARGELFVGYLNREYDATTLNDIDDVAYGASLLWNPTQITSVNIGINRTVEETTVANSSGYINTNYSAGLQHELRRNILLGAGLSFSTNEYESTAANAREDEIFTANTEVRYLINSNASAKLGYQYQDRDSNLANQDYAKNTLTLGLGVGF